MIFENVTQPIWGSVGYLWEVMQEPKVKIEDLNWF